MPENLTDWATVATAVIALIALSLAWKQITVTKHEGRLATAKAIYKDYLALAFANPEYSSPSYPKDAPPFTSFSAADGKYERYEFFVSYLLFAAEEILILTHNEGGWRNTLRDQLRYHALYLGSPDFLSSHYSPELLSLKQEAISTYNTEEN